MKSFLELLVRQRGRRRFIAIFIFLKKDFQYCDKLTAKGMKIHFKLIPDEQGLSWESVKNGLLKGE